MEHKATLGGAFTSMFSLVVRTVGMVERGYDVAEKALDTAYNLADTAETHSAAYREQAQADLAMQAKIRAAENMAKLQAAEARIAEIKAGLES